MDLQTVSIILSVVAVIVSIAGVIDSRRQTSIMKEEAESKKGIRGASKLVSKIQEQLSKIDTSMYNWGGFDKVAYLKMLEYLHDSGKTEITWKTYTSEVFGKMFASSLESCATFELFLSFFEQAAKGSKKKLTIEFLSEPRMRVGSGSDFETIEVGDYVKDIYSLRLAVEDLNSIEKVIDIYDPSICDDIKSDYLKIVRAFHERLLSGYSLLIKSDVKTKDLPNHLLGFIAFEIWLQCVEDLKDRIVPRLNEVQRRILEVV